MTTFGLALEVGLQGTRWLPAAVAGTGDEVSRATCAALLQGSLGGRFPECLEEIVLGRVRENVDSEKRNTAIIRTVLKRVLIAIKRLHSLGENLYTVHLLCVLRPTGRLHRISA